ncbi:MAG: OmpA family protein [Deltaproteobacteria bacterium]|nr:OmpA family protein [Deltaproteobacteria bacterium]
MIALSACVALLAAACGPTYPNCDNDENCHQGEYCVNGQCQACRDDNDCPAGQSCNAGRCDPIDGYCSSAADCPDGQECQGNRCVATQSMEMPMADETPSTPPPCSLSPVYFDFDADNLSSGTRDAIQANARCIQERGIARVHLTGYCDPRGTEEYNLALGDRRARNVKRFLVSLGVSRRSVSASSVGEEMATGTSESSWSRDRRVDFTER